LFPFQPTLAINTTKSPGLLVCHISKKWAVLFKRRIDENDNEHYLSKERLLTQKKVSSQRAAEVIQQSILHL